MAVGSPHQKQLLSPGHKLRVRFSSSLLLLYVKVSDQYYYICVILDLFSRKVLSYRISNTIDTALSLTTFDDAFQQRQQPNNLMFHSDQGSQYTAFVFRQHLRELKVKQSFSTPGNPYDNSVCESFFHTLKKEALYHHLYETPQELEEVLILVTYVKLF